MKHFKTIKLTIICLGFLSLLYGLAHMDQPHRKTNNETTAMAENEPTKTVEMAEQKIMYLTFNDGPSENTQGILDILDHYHIKATFFVTGSNPEYFDLLKIIHERGHVLALHTYSHDYETIYADANAYFQDLTKLENLLNDQVGIQTNILRFPEGSANIVANQYHEGIMSELVKDTERFDYVYYDWNGENGDHDPELSPTTLYQNALASVEGKDTVMMLMHDGSENANTLKALDQTLQEFQRQGWEFRVIEESHMPVFHQLEDNSAN